MNTGFREMLRDRVPKTVDCALKWCKAKERWLDHAYYSFINIYVDKEERYKATKLVLGWKSKKKNHFEFHDTIDWDNLSGDRLDYWITVESWVNWFTSNMLYIKNTYDISKLRHNESEIIEIIKDNHLTNCIPEIQDRLAMYLYKYLSGE